MKLSNCLNYINNIDFHIDIIDNHELMIVNDSNYDLSYISSLGNHYTVYPLDELFLFSKKEQYFYRMFFFCLKKYFQYLKLNKFIYINNQGLSTNLFNNNDFIKKETLDKIIKKYPDYLIIQRSFNDVFYKEKKQYIEDLGFSSLISRKFWYVKKENMLNCFKKRDVKNDKKLFESYLLNGHTIMNNDYFLSLENDNQIWCEIENLYNSLYLDKYSANNPAFTKDWFYYTCKNNIINYSGIFEKNKLKGIIGVYKNNDISTVPVLGYNINENYYRVLSYLILISINDLDTHYHCSSGAGLFKKTRGAVTDYEYQMVYHKHLKKSNQINNLIKLINKTIIKHIGNKDI